MPFFIQFQQQLVQIIIEPMFALLSAPRYYLQRTARQARFWKPKHYQAIPHYVKPHFIDIHDTYKLRTREEVLSELSAKPFTITVQKIYYNNDIGANLKERKAILLADIEQFELTELQMARFKVLVGPRYNEQTRELKLTCQMFDNYDQNHTKIHEMFHDIMMETKRAP